MDAERAGLFAGSEGLSPNEVRAGTLHTRPSSRSHCSVAEGGTRKKTIITIMTIFFDSVNERFDFMASSKKKLERKMPLFV